MRPVELTIEGFTSFRNKTQIDFSKLELFAITGQTGAGKSSLLDAMTLALYGKVSRFGGKTQPKELLSQGSLKLQVTLRFLVDKTEYQVSRSWLYRTKTAQATFKLDKRVDGEWESVGEQKEAEITASIEQILRMNFETFTKVILLPQGKFDEFLKGKGADRRKILRELAGYEIFELMRQKADKQASLLTGEYRAIQNRLDSWDLPSATELNEKRHQYKVLAQELPLLSTVWEKARIDLEQARKLFERLQRLAVWRQELDRLNQQATQIAALQQQLEQARVCDRLSAIWTSVDSARNQYKKSQLNLATTEKTWIQAQADLKSQEQELRQAQAQQALREAQLKEREQALNSAKIYEEQRSSLDDEVKRLNQIFAKKADEQTSVEKTVKVVSEELNQKRDELEQANEKLSHYMPGDLRLEHLNQVAPLLIQWQGIQNQVESDRTKLQQITQQLQKFEQECQTATINWEKAEAEFSKVRAQLETARQQNQAATLRSLLHTGDDCPVCGGIYPEAHLLPPLADSLLDIKSLEKQERSTDEQRKKAADTKIKAETTRENLKQQETEYHQFLREKENNLAALTQQISLILETEEWEVNALQSEYQGRKESDAKYQEALRKKEKLEADFSKSTLNLEFAQKNLAEVRSQLSSATSELERQQAKLQEIVVKLSEITGGEAYDTLSQQIEQDKQELDAYIKQSNQSYQTTRDKFLEQEQKYEKAGEDLQAAAREKERLEAEWQVKLEAARLTEEIFLKAKVTPEAQNQWQQQIDAYSRQKIELETSIKRETDEIDGETTDAEAIAQLETALGAADEGRKQAQNEYNQLSVWIAKAEDKLNQAEQLQAELTSKQQELETYNTLSKELKSDRFQAYILQHFERDLVEQATVMLRELTDQRYALIYDDKEYFVEDRWNGGEARRVQTLSGGETFATSLSLALALSEKLSHGAKLGSLFIDEGFGTLDAETLESVCNILQSLGQQDRLVGVITHVPALGEQLGKQIKVEKFPEGSRVVV